jgi:hypothetical protein
MRIAICDDLAQEREKLKHQLSTVLKNDSIAEFEDGNDLIEAHKKMKFDFVFLDILMPAISGMETAAKIRETDKSTPIVFVSTSEEFGVASYRVLAFDYILKPIDQKQLCKTLKRFSDKKPKKHYITINYERTETKILLSNIICLESNLKKITFYLNQNREITLIGKLSDYEPYLLSHGFLRCHKSYLLNVVYVDSIFNEDFYLTNGKIIKITRTYQAEAKKAYFDYVFGKETRANE